MKLWAMLCMALLVLGGCGGKHVKRVENLYAVKAVEFNRDGVEAMRYERWSAAERAFSRSLKAAQLADESEMVVHAWYNLASVRAAQGEQSAEAAYAQAMELADRYNMPDMKMRARLSLALWQLGRGQTVQPVDVSGRWPVDVYLMGGRLAQKLQDRSAAQSAYQQAARSAGRDAAGLKMQAEAHMGLALLARDAGDVGGIRVETAKALELCRQVGAPRLTANLLLLRASVPEVAAERGDEVERAYSIYEALADVEGERQALQVWIGIAQAGGDTALAESLDAKLKALPAPGDAGKTESE
ncbi:MAG TPA: hypothetical protein VNI58_03200 [Mariprofundaceae bacterium]|nr:hypothetical protein [Mariprofundaceae bacterium]